MHCPNCGNPAVAEQKFCRACGLELQAISHLVTQQLSGKTGATPSQHQAKQVACFARRLFFGVCVLLTGALLLAWDKKLGPAAPPIGLLGVLMVLGGTLLALYAVLAPMMHPQKVIRQTARPVELPAAETTSKLVLASGVEPAASIIEHTTRSLESVANKATEAS